MNTKTLKRKMTISLGNGLIFMALSESDTCYIGLIELNDKPVGQTSILKEASFSFPPVSSPDRQVFMHTRHRR